MVGPLGDRDDGDGGGKGLEDAPTGPGIQQPGAEVVSIRYLLYNSGLQIRSRFPKICTEWICKVVKTITFSNFPEKIKVKRN